MRLLERLFPDRLSYVLWFLALLWMVSIAYWGYRFLGYGGPGLIFGGILIAFSPLPVGLLWTRDAPDVGRGRKLAERRKQRLMRRMKRRP